VFRRDKNVVEAAIVSLPCRGVAWPPCEQVHLWPLEPEENSSTVEEASYLAVGHQLHLSQRVPKLPGHSAQVGEKAVPTRVWVASPIVEKEHVHVFEQNPLQVVVGSHV